jgi:hypothetical protein
MRLMAFPIRRASSDVSLLAPTLYRCESSRQKNQATVTPLASRTT